MQDKKYQVFISSTFIDLKDSREKVSKQILSMYHFPIGMEMFSAGDSDQWTVIKNTIDKSDYYILILGHRYGSLADDGISYTEKEYNYAKEKGIPILAFIKSRDAATTPHERESDPIVMAKLDKFVENAKANKMCDFWNNEDELASKVTAALYKAFTNNPRNGWVRADEVPSSKTLNELASLSKENRELKEELSSLKKLTISRLPDLKLYLNDSNSLELSYSSDITIGTKCELVKITEQEVPESIKGMISKEEIENYNSLIEEANLEVRKYNQEVKIYRIAQEFGVECEVSIENSGQIKANNIFIDIEFPEEVTIVEGGFDALFTPKAPTLPKNPIAVAKRKFESRTSAKALAGISSMAGIYGTDYKDNTFLSGRLSTINAINFDKDNFINFSSNDLMVKCKSLMHTRVRTLKEKFLIVPRTPGNFEIKVSIICEEYLDSILKIIPLKIKKVNPDI